MTAEVDPGVDVGKYEMTGTPGTIGQISPTFLQRLEEMRREAEERRRAAQEDLDELAALEFAGDSSDGCVRVTVDGHGAVRGVRVDPGQLRTAMGDELGRKVVEAARSALSAHAEASRDVLERLSGGDPLQRLADSVGPSRR
ncbi:MAG: hypothetical protein GEV03_04380 [Streptosporangiales bacterium]|nr:hypothetical protein [Streptosporangiales bacterium]